MLLKYLKKILIIFVILYDENYNWCMINLGSKRMYKGFDEIVLVNSNSDNEIEKINNIYKK